MRKVMLLTCLFLAAGAAAAETKAAIDHGPQPTLEQLMKARATDPRFAEAESSRPLFFRLPDGATEVEFRVNVGRHAYLRETVRPRATTNDAPAVEFLARDTARLERLYRLAEHGTLPVTVTVQVGGATVREFAFADFVAYNRDLKNSGLRPVASESTLQLLAPEPPARAVAERPAAAPRPDGPCEDQCYDDYIWCTQNYCGPDPLPYAKTGADRPWCEYCSNEYDACLAGCQPCTDPRSVNDYSTTELVSVYGLNWDCFRDWWDPNPFPTYGQWYQLLQLNYKVTNYRRTVYCDWHEEVVVTGVSYPVGYCFYPQYIQCYYPFQYPYMTCY